MRLTFINHYLESGSQEYIIILLVKVFYTFCIHTNNNFNCACCCDQLLFVTKQLFKNQTNCKPYLNLIYYILIVKHGFICFTVYANTCFVDVYKQYNQSLASVLRFPSGNILNKERCIPYKAIYTFISIISLHINHHIQ